VCIEAERIDSLILPRAMSRSMAATRLTQLSDAGGGATEARSLHELQMRSLHRMADRGPAPTGWGKFRLAEHFDRRIGLSGCRRIDARERPRLWTQGVFTR
jgi:hypothetical protein